MCDEATRRLTSCVRRISGATTVAISGVSAAAARPRSSTSAALRGCSPAAAVSAHR